MNAGIITGYVMNSKGVRLYTRRSSPSEPRALIVIAHGFGEHAGRYAHVMEHLVRNNIAVSAFDMRGHGKSDGRRGDVKRFFHWVDDLHMMIREFRRYVDKSIPVILLGHSLGGLIALNYLSVHDDVDGAIISSPPLGSLTAVPAWKVRIGCRTAKLLPRFRVSAEIDPNNLSRDPIAIAEYIDDPLVLKRITLRAGQALVEHAADAMPLAYHVTCPILMLQGRGDKICSSKTTQLFYDNIPSPKKRLRLYDGAFHEPFNDIIKERVFADLDEWIGRLLQRRESTSRTRGTAVFADQVSLSSH